MTKIRYYDILKTALKGGKMKKLSGLIALVVIAALQSEALANQPPTATFTTWPKGWAYTNQVVVFDGTQSKDDGWIVAYEWDFNSDGWPDKFGPQVEYAFSLPGEYFVTLLVRDNWGAVGTSYQKFRVIPSQTVVSPPIIYQPPPPPPPSIPQPIIINVDLSNLSEKEKAIILGVTLILISLAILIKTLN